MPSDFIDRAKLVAAVRSGFARYATSELENRGIAEVTPLDAITDAVLALLDAETTEEWGVRGEVGGFPFQEGPFNRAFAEQLVSHGNRELVSRRVARTPWLPSEGGES